MPLEFGAAKLFGVTSGYSANVLAVGRIVFAQADECVQWCCFWGMEMLQAHVSSQPCTWDRAAALTLTVYILL